MRILAWNICQGGGDHDAIAKALVMHEPDVIVLSEHQTDRTAPLIEKLRAIGYPHFFASPTEGRRNGVALLSKKSLAHRPPPFGEIPFAWWGVEAAVGGLTIIGVYAPLATSWDSSPQIQREFWNAVHAMAVERIGEPVLLIGDYNTCAPVVDGPNPQPCWDAFDHLSKLGWVDAWRAVNGEARDHSWVQRRVTPNTNWRIDHAFVSPPLSQAVKACRYSHAERENLVSDHSILMIEIDAMPITVT